MSTGTRNKGNKTHWLLLNNATVFGRRAKMQTNKPMTIFEAGEILHVTIHTAIIFSNPFRPLVVEYQCNVSRKKNSVLFDPLRRRNQKSIINLLHLLFANHAVFLFRCFSLRKFHLHEKRLSIMCSWWDISWVRKIQYPHQSSKWPRNVIFLLKFMSITTIHRAVRFF